MNRFLRTLPFQLLIAATCAILVTSPQPAAAEGKTVLLVNMKYRDKVSGAYKRLDRVVEGLVPGVNVEIVHYEKVTPSLLTRIQPKALILGPQGTPWWEYDKKKIVRFAKTLQEFKGPVLGICGGHQYLAIAYGGEVGPIHCPKKRDGYKGCKGEHGFETVLIRDNDDPLFAGLPISVVMKESHYEEVKDLPNDFEVIASTALSQNQVIKHRSRTLYGVQFHPEIHDGKHPHGKRLLKNFLEMAGLR